MGSSWTASTPRRMTGPIVTGICSGESWITFVPIAGECSWWPRPSA